MNKLSAYNSFFGEIIDTINSSRYQAFKSLNKFHIGQNFEIGRIIVENQNKNQWGQSIVDTLSKDINKQIDGVKGYSPQNLDFLFSHKTIRVGLLRKLNTLFIRLL